MSDRTTLKSYFEDGDIPTGANFADLIDSLALVAELTAHGAASDPHPTYTTAAELAAALAGYRPITEKSQAIFTIEGILSVGTGTLRIRNRTGRTLTISEVYCEVDTAPVGAAIIVDVNNGGTTIFTNQAHRPQIAAGANVGNTTTIDVPAWSNNTYLTIDRDQVGSTTPGSDLVVTVIYS